MARMFAVHIVCIRNKSIQEAADDLMQCPDWVTNWVQHFEKESLDGLLDLPRSGRPPIISHKKMRHIMDGATSQSRITSVMLQQDIHKQTGIKLHITYVRKIMHRHGLSPKRPTRIHINSASKRADSTQLVVPPQRQDFTARRRRFYHT